MLADAIRVIIKDLVTTNGRVPRSTFWWFHVGLLVLFLFIGLLSESKAIPESLTSILAFLMFPVLIMRIIVEIKRWHDRDKSGWWFLIGFIPVLGWLWILIECGFLPGTKGKNRFGADPLEI
jgi:uncharacterized membrane protein YhaH (DUF805 family)